jgi:hypothetical protein
MGAANFCYENRCIVVTNEDFEFGNVPAHNKFHPGSLHSYPSYFLDDSDFEFWDVVLTAGYYEAACIDYERNSACVEDWIGCDWISQKDFFEDIHYQFGLSYYKIRKLCGNIGDMEFWRYTSKACDAITDYLADLERDKVNEFLDKLKSDYGFEEYGVSARFSNGETWYSKI